jgi:hypothetical protein
MVSSFPYPPQFLGYMREVFANPQPFIAACIAAAAENNLTGYNIDWEPTDGGGVPTAADAAAYTAFLTLFSDAMHAAGLLTSVDVATWSPIWDLPLLAKTSVDYVMTMNTYTGNDDLFISGLDAVVKAIPASKLCVGLETTNDDSVPAGLPFNDTAVALRFEALSARGLDRVAIWRTGIPDNFWPYLKAKGSE